MMPGIGVAVFVVNSENKILIGKRIPSNVWALAGGKV
jgi:ADP-ribose pyrophosphatase YjhB (NUDIX family)